MGMKQPQSRTFSLAALSIVLAGVLVPSLPGYMAVYQTFSTSVCVSHELSGHLQLPLWVTRASAPVSAFPDFPCHASPLSQRLYLLKRWLPQWWGLGLRRLLWDGPRHVEYTLLFFTAGLPALYLAALLGVLGVYCTSRGTAVVLESQVHLAYGTLLLFAADIVSPINSILAGFTPNDFRLPQFTEPVTLYRIALARGILCVLFKVRKHLLLWLGLFCQEAQGGWGAFFSLSLPFRIGIT